MINFNAVEYSKLGRFENYNLSEIRAQNARYGDPLTLNFKLLIDYDKPYGLFASEDNVNSALAYLKRIGQDVRYELLKNWISLFKMFTKDFDYLMLQAEGLDTFIGKNPNHICTDEDKLNLIVREPADMFFQSLITNWRQIWFDDTRGVEVLPINLRRFDMKILIFASGYYNMLYYDNEGYQETMERLIFPTVRKLSTEIPDYKAFHHIMFSFYDASINHEDSGKNFFQSITNEQSSDYIRNNITFNFKFVRSSGQFNAISGAVDYGALLAMTATYVEQSKNAEIKKSFMDKLKDAGKSVWNNTKETTITRVNQIDDKVLSKNSVIGDIWSKVNSLDYATNMVKNTASLGINKVFESTVDNPLTKINNLVNLNFGNNIYELINNNTNQRPNNSTQYRENPPNTDEVRSVNFAQEQNSVTGGVRLNNSNVYRR